MSALPRLSIGSLTFYVEGAALRVDREDDVGQARVLSVAALEAIVRRYGRPLADGVDASGDFLALVGGARLRALSFRGPVDVIANDYVVLERGGEALAVPAPLFVAVVAALSR